VCLWPQKPRGLEPSFGGLYHVCMCMQNMAMTIFTYVIATIALSFLLVYSLILLLTLFVTMIFSNEKLKRK
jgi:Mn2+/Fe2+ NRAMP family transporter